MIFFPACLWICQPLLSCLSTRGSWHLASASITSRISLLASTAHPLWEALLTTQRLMATAWIKNNYYCLSCNKILNKKTKILFTKIIIIKNTHHITTHNLSNYNYKQKDSYLLKKGLHWLNVKLATMQKKQHFSRFFFIL